MYDQKDIDALKEVQGWERHPPEAALRTLWLTQTRTGLDPLSRHLYLTPRGNRWTIMTSIDGMRLVAHRVAREAGGVLMQNQPEWSGQDGAWRDLWVESQPPAAARVRVGLLLPGFAAPAETTAVAHMSEYKPRKGSRLWETMPALMLAKCAEALALRRTCPAELSGLYTADEMAQAEGKAGGHEGAGEGLTVDEARQALAGIPPQRIKAQLEAMGAARVGDLTGAQRQELVKALAG